MNKEHVYITKDRKVTILERRLIEVSLPDNEMTEEEIEEVNNYFFRQTTGDGSVYPNPDCGSQPNLINDKIEAFFWIPPTEELLEETYKDAPRYILESVRAAFISAKEKGGEDYGYALIGFF